MLEGVSFALGAAMATTREKLRAIGGLEALADYLADDYMLGNLIHRAGFEVRLSPHVVQTMPVHSSFANMIRHQVRWARGTRMCRPLSYAGYVITHGTALGLLCMIAAKASLPSVVLFCLAMTARMMMAWRVGVQVLKDQVLARNLWLLPIRDMLSFGVWCASFFGRRVEWRGKSYRIVEDGKLEPVPEK
jgi:ceramide glucosyltransferase